MAFSNHSAMNQRGFEQVCQNRPGDPGAVHGGCPRYPWRVSRFLDRFAVLASLAVSASVSACAPDAPPRWAEGGAPLVISPARWDRPNDDPVEIQPNGRVLEGGKLRFVIDRVGRVTDDDYEAFAVIEPDGHIVGTDSRPLGYVGMSNATPPFADQAWLSVQADGRVLFFEPSGDRSDYGKWSKGCAGPSRRTCTLVTQLFTVRNYRTAPTGPRFGVGIGVGMGF